MRKDTVSTSLAHHGVSAKMHGKPPARASFMDRRSIGEATSKPGRERANGVGAMEG